MSLLRGALRGAATAGLEIVDKRIDEGFQKRREARLQGVKDAEHKRGRTDKAADVANDRAYQGNLLKSKNKRADKIRSEKRSNTLSDLSATHANAIKVAGYKEGQKESPEIKSLRKQFESTQSSLDKSLATGIGDVKALEVRLARIQDKIVMRTDPDGYAAHKKQILDLRLASIQTVIQQGQSFQNKAEVDNFIKGLSSAGYNADEIAQITQQITQVNNQEGIISPPVQAKVATPAPYAPQAGAEGAGYAVGQGVREAAGHVGSAAGAVGGAVNGMGAIPWSAYQKHVGQPFEKAVNGAWNGLLGR